MPSVLIADDEPNLRRMLASLLRAEGYRTREASRGDDAVAAVQEEEPDVLLLDLVMPGMDGVAALERLHKVAPSLPVLMMSGRATLSDAVRATKLGAVQFLEKPLSPEAVLVALRAAVELRRTRDLNRTLRARLADEETLVGESAPMRAVREMTRRVAPTDARVLITGESGTGKELAAAAIHRLSARADGPFVRLNCAALPRELVESELFGHEKGAFTGAGERRRGHFEMAEGGTILLDEIGDLDPAAQAKLLRTLETGQLQRLGSEEAIAVDVRVLAATNRELERAVAEGGFREDLYFRLNVIPLHLPPLRERPEDVPALVEHVLERIRTREGRPPPRITRPAHDRLAAHRWPGNVRELNNLVERLSILHAGQEVGEEELRPMLAPPAGEDAGDSAGLSERLERFERRLIEEALTEAEENLAAAARILQTDRANLYRRMKRLGIDR
jgi:two-component system, NtrC family, nitrogen regulation response regulator NtrX